MTKRQHLCCEMYRNYPDCTPALCYILVVPTTWEVPQLSGKRRVHHSKGLLSADKVHLAAAYASPRGHRPGVTCEVTLDSSGGTYFCLICPDSFSGTVDCAELEDRLIQPHVAFGSWLSTGRWDARVSVALTHLPLWHASWTQAADASRDSGSCDVKHASRVVLMSPLMLIRWLSAGMSLSLSGVLLFRTRPQHFY